MNGADADSHQGKAFWLYRHAESVANAGGRTFEVSAIALTEKGEAQAAELAQTIDAVPSLVVSSPFLRAAQTALPIRRRFDRSLAAIWPIQEFTYLAPASCVGTSWVERKPRIDAYWDRLDPAYVDGPGAESFSDLLGRVRNFLTMLRTAQTPFNVLVSHGQFMQAAHVLIDDPNVHDQDAIGVFRARQSARPFANCERLRIEISAVGEVRAVRD